MMKSGVFYLILLTIKHETNNWASFSSDFIYRKDRKNELVVVVVVVVVVASNDEGRMEALVPYKTSWWSPVNTVELMLYM